MHQQSKYILIFLTLTLFGFVALGHSQDVNNHASEEPNPVEELNGEPNSVEVRFKNLEDRLDFLQSQFSTTNIRFDNLENPPTNWIQISIIIFGALAILAFVVAILLRLREVGQQREEFDAITQRFQKKIDENVRGLEKSLAHIRQVGKENAEKLKNAESEQSLNSNEHKNIHNVIAEIKGRIDHVDLTLGNLESDSGTDDAIDYQSEIEAVVQEAQGRMEELARAYRAGESIDLNDLETPTPSQKVLLLLNSLVRDLHQWKTESEQSENVDPNLVETLIYRENDIKNKLKEIRADFPPDPKPLHVQTDANTDAELNEIENQCNVHVARFEGMLSGYEQGREVDLEEYNQFIPHFITNRLFNGVAGFVQFEQLPAKIDKFLQLVGCKVVPIEIGKTKADAHFHEIQSSQQTDADSGTVVAVVLPGLQRIADGEIVQKPIVIRGE